MSWDWQVFCQDTMDREVVQSCFGKGGEITYLDWMLSASSNSAAGMGSRRRSAASLTRLLSCT